MVESGIDPQLYWLAMQTHMSAGYTELLVKNGKEVDRVLPTLPLAHVVEFLSGAPGKIQERLYGTYVGKADLTGYSLREFAKIVRDLSPGIGVLVWVAWLTQTDRSLYNATDVRKALKKSLPDAAILRVEETVSKQRLSAERQNRIG